MKAMALLAAMIATVAMGADKTSDVVTLTESTFEKETQAATGSSVAVRRFRSRLIHGLEQDRRRETGSSSTSSNFYDGYSSLGADHC